MPLIEQILLFTLCCALSTRVVLGHPEPSRAFQQMGVEICFCSPTGRAFSSD